MQLPVNSHEGFDWSHPAVAERPAHGKLLWRRMTAAFEHWYRLRLLSWNWRALLMTTH